MPATTVLFGVAALGASGLPLGAGFVSEWLLVQALVHAPRPGGTMLALALPLAVGAIALTTGLGVVAMVKAFGLGFLARPRTPEAAQAREASPGMLAGMSLAAGACVVVAVAPLALGPVLQRAGGGPRLGAELRLPGLSSSMAPGLIAAGLVSAALLSVIVTRWGARHRPAPTPAPLWACGAERLSARMQYTATSFAEPLQRVFDDVLRPDTDIEITHLDESRYLPNKVAYRTHLRDVIEDRLYRPLLVALGVGAGWLRRAHTGSIHLSLAYGGLGLLIVLLVAR
jgi:NADH:ubiquinone oxidoreductase subunit 5 (subunit L)/multisubunit Na+/H+ antiporter MnhA subunit